MISGDKDDLFAAAKSEKDVELRREAIRQLGLVHGVDELQQLYRIETSTEVTAGTSAGVFPRGRCQDARRSRERRRRIPTCAARPSAI